MDPNISEFSFAYAFTEDLISSTSLPIIGAPIFPTLRQEGAPGGGYDVAIPFDGSPLFLQFKLSHCMIHSNANESDEMGLPYYRMHLRPTKHSDQHPMLLELEEIGNLVFYVAPRFHTPTELNRAYLDREILPRSIFIRPSFIGELDEDSHYVVFSEIGRVIVHSTQSKEIPEEMTNDKYFINNVIDHMQSRGFDKSSEIELQSLIDVMIDIIEISKEKGYWKGIDLHELPINRKPLSIALYLSRTFFGCELFIAGDRTQYE